MKFYCKKIKFTNCAMEQKNKKIMVSIWLASDIVKAIDHVAKKGQLTRSRVIHNLISVGHDELNFTKNIGIVKLTLLFKKFKESVRPVLSEAEKRVEFNESASKKDSVSVRMDKELLDKIDVLADKLGYTRKSLIEYMLEFGSRDLKILSNVPGFVETVVILRDIEEAVKLKWEKTFKKTEEIMKSGTIDLKENSENGSEK